VEYSNNSQPASKTFYKALEPFLPSPNAQIAVSLSIAFFAGTLSNSGVTSLWDLAFRISLLCAFLSGTLCPRLLFFIGLSLVTNLLARIVFHVAAGTEVGMPYYFGMAATFFASVAAFVGTLTRHTWNVLVKTSAKIQWYPHLPSVPKRRVVGVQRRYRLPWPF